MTKQTIFKMYRHENTTTRYTTAADDNKLSQTDAGSCYMLTKMIFGEINFNCFDTIMLIDFQKIFHFKKCNLNLLFTISD